LIGLLEEKTYIDIKLNNLDTKEQCVSAIEDLALFENLDIEKILTTYGKGSFWSALENKLELIQDTQKELEQREGLKLFERLKKGKNNESNEVESEETVEDRLANYNEKVKEYAYKILKNSDAFKFILTAWNKKHIGDINFGENCLCSVVCRMITNTKGLPQKPSGESGKGKSDAFETVLYFLPNHFY
jgi:hypothetical protein